MAKNAVEKIRQLLFNFDLELENAKAELAVEQAKIERFANKTSKTQIKNYLLARIEEEKLKAFIVQLNRAKDDVFRNIDNILSLYTPKYKKIWIKKYLSNMSASDIAEETGYGIDNINRIVKKLKNDLISYQLIDELIDDEDYEDNSEANNYEEVEEITLGEEGKNDN